MNLIDRLREQAQWHNDGHGPLHKEAADEIERLRALLRRTAAVLASAAAGTRCSIAAGDLYRDIIAAEIISDEQSPKFTAPDENGRQYEEGMQPSDDAEFGCKP